MSISLSTTSPLHQALAHFPGIGPVRLKLLQEAGIDKWEDIDIAPPPALAAWHPRWQPIYDTAMECREADANDNIQFFIDHLKTQDRWRLLHTHWRQCAFLDIETSGLDFNADITVISVYYQNQLKLFVKDENLDDFPDYVLQLPFLVTYNGSTFDLPKIIRNFNLPPLPVPHVDLRWICHRANLDGGLKPIEHTLNIIRPAELQGTDGNEAIQLWQRWQATHDEQSRYKLLKYCAADTISLKLVTDCLLARQGHPLPLRPEQQSCWNQLQQIPQPLATAPEPPPPQCLQDNPSNQVSLSSLQQRLKNFLNQKRRPQP